MTTRGRYLRLHVCIDNRRALSQRLFTGAAREFPMTVPAAAVQCASALIRDDGTGGRRGLGHPFLHFKFFLRSSNTYSIGSIVKINRLMQRNIRNTFFDMHWCFPTSKKAPRLLLLACTRPALHALTTRVSSLMTIYSVVPSTANRSYFEKPCKVKM